MQATHATFSSEPIARTNGCATVRTYTGHGINDLFHCSPNVPHYAKNKAVGTMKAGMVSLHIPQFSSYTDVCAPSKKKKVFTIEPVRGSKDACFCALI